jgi:hypothetical protein
MIGDSVDILLCLIAAFCLIVSRWMSSEGACDRQLCLPALS